MRKWLKDLRRDFLRKEFIPLKILYFFMMGGMMTLIPFLTIQARSLGITGEELGVIYAVIPIIGICAPSLAGLLADKVGNFKIILSLTVLVSGLTSLLFLLIPKARIEHTLPSQLPITVNCTMNGANVTVDSPYTCDVDTKSNKNHTLEIQKCYYRCTNDIQQETLVEEFLNQWCQRTESCEIFDDVVFSSHLESGYEKNNRYDVIGLEIEQGIRRGFALGNESVSLTVTSLPAKRNHLGVSRLFCPNFQQLIKSITMSSPSVVMIDTPQKECWMTCEASTETSSTCKNTKSTEEFNPTLTFVTYLVIRVLNGVLLAVSFTLFQGAVVAILKQNKGDLGLQKVYANLGMIVMTPISGMLIDVFSKMNNKEDYSPAFAIYFVIKCLCAFCMLFINLEFKQPSNRVLKDFKELISQARVLAFISFSVLIGSCFGFVETFLFWLLEDLGADKSLMGITVTVGAAFGIPLLLVSSNIIEKLGHVNTLVMCSFAYFVRLIGYSLINDPWLAMPFEALETFTNSLLIVTAISYAGVLSKPTTVASLQGIYGGVYHGVGRGLGSLIGGILIKKVGNSATFQIFALCCAIGGMLYYAVNRFVFSDSNAKKETEASIENVKEVPSEQLEVGVNIENCIDNSSKNKNETDGSCVPTSETRSNDEEII